MVVTRRTPVVPQPPPARNFSSQGAQRPLRTSRSKDIADVSKDAASSTAAASLVGPSNGNKDHRNGLDNSPRRKSRKSRKHGKNKHEKSNFQAFLDFLTKLLLLAFTIYTFSVCPQDTQLQSPICRGLTEYKRIVLDPYIILPIQTVLAHPSVSPHVAQARPYVQRAVEITAPILFRTQQEWNLHVVPQWEKRIVPEWNKRIVPQWKKHIISHWDKLVAPRIQRVQSTLEPYRLRITQEYEQRILPHAQVAIYNLQRGQRQAEPYVLLAVSKTKNAYYAAKPYAIPIARRCGYLLQQFALFLREQRQKFVDPHVAQIWEKVKKLSRGRQALHETTPERESLLPDTLFTLLETLEYETTTLSDCSPTSANEVIPIIEETDVAHSPPSFNPGETTDDLVPPTFAEPTLATVPEPVTSTQLAGSLTDLESSLGVESVLAESLHESEPAISGASVFVEELDSAKSSVLVAPTTASPSSAPAADEPTSPPVSVTPSKITVAAARATVPPMNLHADDEIDFDAFYAELGLDEPLENSGDSVEHNTGPPSPPAETEQERAERLRLKAEETARKRVDIEARQAKWEAELQAQMEHSTSQLQSRLGDLRTAAATELASSPNIRSSIEELVSEAEKYIKGAEIYLKNLKGENRKSDEKLTLWERVADRVNAKFNERLLATERVVNAWYGIVLDKELQEVATAAAKVRDLAEKGQLDLGLDYAWLEDVTYDDWQRYHALIGTSERYAHEASSIQNGTHPKVVVSNPMNPILEDLESEVQDVVIGFETRLRRIKRDGERAFNNNGNGVAQKEEEKGSSTEPVGAQPEVSILPVPGEGVKDEPGFVPLVIIGRSKEEVLETLGRVEPVSEERSKGGSSVDPEEAVSHLAQEVEGGAAIDRTEL